jgi:hypothetical protein
MLEIAQEKRQVLARPAGFTHARMRTPCRACRRRRSGARGLVHYSDEATVADWEFAQRDPTEELAQLHYFSFKKRQPDGEIEFVITVKEYAPRNKLQMRFYAQADKELNQRTAPFRPFGWGDTLSNALGECMRAIRQFPYEGDAAGSPRS